jgi:hypothetical protein
MEVARSPGPTVKPDTPDVGTRGEVVRRSLEGIGGFVERSVFDTTDPGGDRRRR